MQNNIKNSRIAGLLNFFLPGVGLLYLGNWKGGLINFFVVVTIGILCGIFLSEDNFEAYRMYIVYGLAGGSGESR